MHRMYFRFMILCVVVMALLPVNAKEEKSPDRLFMWKIVSPGGATVFLFGTVDVYLKETFPLPHQAEQACEQSKYLVLRTDMTKFDTSKFQELHNQKGMYSDEDGLSHHISPRTLETLKALTLKYKIPLDKVERYKPWINAVFIEQTVRNSLGFNQEFDIGIYFQKKFKDSPKKIIAMEAPDELFKHYSDFDAELQDQFLFLCLKEIEIMDNDGYLAAWKAGDGEKIELLDSRNLIKYPDLLPLWNVHLYQTNASHANIIEGYLKTNESYFVVETAARLVGEKGILNLLRKRGYQIEQILREQTPVPSK